MMQYFTQIFFVVTVILLIGFLVLNGRRLGSSRSGRGMVSLMEEQIELSRVQIEESRRQNEIHLRIAEALELKYSNEVRGGHDDQFK